MIKALPVVMILIFLTACDTTTTLYDYTPISEAVDHLPKIEATLKRAMQMYPEMDYTVTVLPDVPAVVEAYREAGGRKDGCNGFYDHRTKEIVVPGCVPDDVLKHEIAHAIVDHYFVKFIPVWLDEMIAEAMEDVPIEY